MKARIGPRYIRDREADLDAAYQDEGALNDALADTWIADMTIDEWQRAVEHRLGLEAEMDQRPGRGFPGRCGTTDLGKSRRCALKILEFQVCTSSRCCGGTAWLGDSCRAGADEAAADAGPSGQADALRLAWDGFARRFAGATDTEELVRFGLETDHLRGEVPWPFARQELRVSRADQDVAALAHADGRAVRLVLQLLYQAGQGLRAQPAVSGMASDHS